MKAEINVVKYTDGRWVLEKVEAEQIKGFPILAFIHRGLGGFSDFWVVSEPFTGAYLSAGRVREEVIERAKVLARSQGDLSLVANKVHGKSGIMANYILV